ncbi:hypothetical protein RQN46_04085 [Arcanobacterium hippocoleae]
MATMDRWIISGSFIQRVEADYESRSTREITLTGTVIGQIPTMKGSTIVCGDNGFMRRLPRIQLWTIGTLSAAGIIALAYGWSLQSDPYVLAILLLLYGGFLPLIVIAFTFVKKMGIKQRVTVFGCCLLMCVTALLFGFFGEEIVASAGIWYG